jgi:hypothetical protein
VERTIIAVGIVVLIIGILYFRNLRKNKKDKAPPTIEPGKKAAEASAETGIAKSPADSKKKKIAYEPIEAYVYNDMTARSGPATLSGKVVGQIINRHGTIGQWRTEDNGKRLYQIRHDREGYHPYYYPYDPNQSSSRLHRALLHPEVELTHDVAPIKTFAQKYGLYILIAGAFIFAVWTTMQH